MCNEIRRWMKLCEVEIPDCAGPCLYHATYREHVRSIMSHGLGAAQNKNFNVSQAGVTYLTDDPDVAAKYAQEAEIVNGRQAVVMVILAIDQTQLDPSLLHKDRNDVGDFGYQDSEDADDEYDNSYNSYEYHGVIPPAALSVYYAD